MRINSLSALAKTIKLENQKNTQRCYILHFILKTNRNQEQICKTKLIKSTLKLLIFYVKTHANYRSSNIHSLSLYYTRIRRLFQWLWYETVYGSNTLWYDIHISCNVMAKLCCQHKLLLGFDPTTYGNKVKKLLFRSKKKWAK